MTSKYFTLLRDSVNSFNLSNVADQSGSRLCKDRVTDQVKKKNSLASVHVLLKTLNLVISLCFFAQDGNEMYQNLYRTCKVIVVLIKPFVL